MKISTEILRGLNACASGYRDFKKAHEDKEILFSECVASGSNSISDYLWFIGKQDLSPSQLKDVKLFTIWCAESCLSVFEAAYPNDNRPREAIEASKRYLTDPTDENAYAADAARKQQAARLLEMVTNWETPT